jgi:hypothetical protein
MLGWHGRTGACWSHRFPLLQADAGTAASDLQRERAYVLSEFDAVIGEQTGDRLWLVFWEKKPAAPGWLGLKVDETGAIIDHLYEIGCRIEFERLFDDVVVDAFQCSSGAQTNRH